MARIWMVTGAIAIAVSTAAAADQSGVQTMTGWFSDAQCAPSRVKKGVIAPNGTACVKRCLEKGATAVFISEETKTMFEVKGYPHVKDDAGYYIELAGTVDDAGKTISVTSVKRLAPVEAMCALPRKGGRSLR
jgi:hypothetical protein